MDKVAWPCRYVTLLLPLPFVRSECPSGTYLYIAPKTRSRKVGGRRHILRRGDDDFPTIKFDDDLFKRGACTACNDTTTQNLQTNLWPQCCTSPLTWTGTACA
jgi:hypothetical protein